jgi:ribonuclease H / adenosylcobalamin/alpha-ribazole phosphatase
MASGSVLYLVRHGESAGNVNPGARRSEDPPLTDQGLAQASRAATALARLGIDAVYSSPLRRARETAEAIADAAGLEVRVRPELGEVDMGALADAATAEGRAERDAIFQAWLAGDRSRAFPGGEDFPAVLRRVREGLRAILAEAPAARVAVVTHRMAIAAAAELAGSEARGACPNGAITTIVPEDGDRLRLEAWGDARHLG